MHIKKGDKVMVISGLGKENNGTISTVLEVFPKKNRVTVEGVNMIKKHVKPSAANQQGGIVTQEAPIHVSNVMPIDPKTKKPTRVSHTKVAGKDGKERSKRVAASGELLDK